MGSHGGLFSVVLVHVLVVLYRPVLWGKKLATETGHLQIVWFLPYGWLPDGGQLIFFGRFSGAVPTDAFCMAGNWPGGAQWFKFWWRGCAIGEAMADHRRPHDMFWAFLFSVPRASELVDSKDR